MVVAQGLALATTEAAMYLYESAQFLWRAWQASAHLEMEPQHLPMLHCTSLHTDPAAASAPTHNGLADPARTGVSTASVSLQQSPAQQAPSQLQKGPAVTRSSIRVSACERAKPSMGILSGTCRQCLGNSGHHICRLLKRGEAVLAVISHKATPAEGITLVLPLGVLIVGGLAATWARCGMPLPNRWLARMPLLFSVAGEPGGVFTIFHNTKVGDHLCLTCISHGCSGHPQPKHAPSSAQACSITGTKKASCS